MNGNPSALHTSGRGAASALEDARESIANLVGAHPTEVVFTSGGSEANTIAVLGAMRTRNRVAAVSAVEHPSVKTVTRHGGQVLPVDESGQVRGPIEGDLSVVSVMLVNNETGIISNLDEVATQARNVGAWMHTDAVQALGHVPFRFDELDVDMASVSAHKIGGPVGIGALLVRRGIDPEPTGLGGDQERKLRPGTQSVALAAGFAHALSETLADFERQRDAYRRWQERVHNVCLAIEHTRVTSAQHPSAPHIVNATFQGIQADDLLLILDAAGIDASVGSACQAGVHRPSQVLLAMGRCESDAGASLRFSFGHTTTDADIDALCDVLADAVSRARAVFRAGILRR